MEMSQKHSQISEGTNLGFEPLPTENCRMHHIISIIFISSFFFVITTFDIEKAPLIREFHLVYIL